VEIWLFAVAIAFLSLDTTAVGQFMVSRPIVVGPVIGFLAGDPMLGLAMGATVELIWIGQLPVGNVLPLDATLLTGLAVALADACIDAGGSAVPKEAAATFALAAALPLAALSSEAEQILRRLHKGWVHRAQQWMETGRFFWADTVNLWVLAGLFAKAFVTAFLSLWALRALARWFLVLPAGMLDGFRYAHWFLLALGCAAAVDLLVDRRRTPVLVTTVVLASLVVLLTDVDALYLLLVALLAGSALCLRDLRSHLSGSPETAEPPPPPEARVSAWTHLSVFLRTFLLQAAWNFERGLNYGFAFALSPLLKRLFPQEERSRALVRHLEYFNTQPYLASFIVGAVARMEAERAGLPRSRQRQKEEEISALKMGMMGPAAALGDNLFWATLRPYAGILAVGLMYAEPFRAAWLPLVVPLLFLAVYNTAHLSVRLSGFLQGLRMGEFVVGAIKRYGFQEAVNAVKNASLLLVGVLMVCMNHQEAQKGWLLFDLKMAFFGGLVGIYAYFLHKRANVAFLFYSAVFIALIQAYWPALSAMPPLEGRP
jgi:PTS system mannose-specific IID component